MDQPHLPWFILLLPLFAAALIHRSSRKSPASLSSRIISVVAGARLLASAACFVFLAGQDMTVRTRAALDRSSARALASPSAWSSIDLSKTMLAASSPASARSSTSIRSVYMRDDAGEVALLRLPLALHVLDARHRSREQLRDDVHLLGTGRRQFLFAHRPLVRARRRGRGREEGIPHQSHRRLRIHARHPDGLDARPAPSSFTDIERAMAALDQQSRLPHGRGAADLLRRGRQDRRNFRSTSGCRTPWKARRRSPR